MNDLKNIDTQQVMKNSKTNFLFSTFLLSKNKRVALKTVYAFCRRTDDIVDEETSTVDEKKNNLNEWKNEVTKAFESKTDYLLLKDLNNITNKFKIPEQPFFDLIKGMELDLIQNRYKTFEDLYKYCYYAASTVGLMTIGIFGYKNEKTIDFAINLGIAFQLTNILRDIYKDSLVDRIYLPLDDLSKFNYSESELKEKVVNENFKSLMKFEIARANEYYWKAKNELMKEDERNMVPALIMEKTYSRILKKIEDIDYDVFSKPVRIPGIKKLLIAISVLLKYKIIG